MYLEPELTELMATNGNYDDHLWAWQNWHEGVGRQLRPLYLRYVELKNQEARLNGFTDYGDQWRQKYETTELETIVKSLYAQVEPLYKQLHAYIRRKLYQTYGPDKVDLRGPLPAHLLSDMWGRFWVNLNEIAIPYPEKPSTDPTPEMIRQNFTAERMFRTGNDFYTSMGLKPVPDTFWTKSMLEKPTDGREVICHATAWDFYDGEDFRIRMCTRVVFEDFQTVHHELGHIQYFMVGSSIRALVHFSPFPLYTSNTPTCQSTTGKSAWFDIRQQTVTLLVPGMGPTMASTRQSESSCP